MRSGESARLPLVWPGFEYRRRRHLWVEFVVGSLPCSEGFSPGSPVFRLPPKTNISKFQFDLESVDEKPLRGYTTANSHLLYFIHPGSEGPLTYCRSEYQSLCWFRRRRFARSLRSPKNKQPLATRVYFIQHSKKTSQRPFLVECI